jgi:hypothetical protein
VQDFSILNLKSPDALKSRKGQSQTVGRRTIGAAGFVVEPLESSYETSSDMQYLTTSVSLSVTVSAHSGKCCLGVKHSEIQAKWRAIWSVVEPDEKQIEFVYIYEISCNCSL